MTSPGSAQELLDKLSQSLQIPISELQRSNNQSHRLMPLLAQCGKPILGNTAILLPENADKTVTSVKTMRKELLVNMLDRAIVNLLKCTNTAGPIPADTDTPLSTTASSHNHNAGAGDSMGKDRQLLPNSTGQLSSSSRSLTYPPNHPSNTTAQAKSVPPPYPSSSSNGHNRLVSFADDPRSQPKAVAGFHVGHKSDLSYRQHGPSPSKTPSNSHNASSLAQPKTMHSPSSSTMPVSKSSAKSTPSFRSHPQAPPKATSSNATTPSFAHSFPSQQPPRQFFFNPQQAFANQPLDPRLDTEKKVALFKALRQTPGLKSSEIVEAICNTEDESQLNEDILLAQIISKREHIDPWLAAMKAQEDAELDRAILESEQERDHIQARKRRRKEEFSQSLYIAIGDAEEVQASLLLHGLPSLSGENSTSSSSSEGQIGLMEPLHFADSLQGSLLIQSLVHVFDYCKDDDHISCLLQWAGEKGIVMEKATLQALRAEVVNLLIVEAQALKFYRNEAHGHLLYLANKLDSQSFLVDILPTLRKYRDIMRQSDLGKIDKQQGEIIQEIFSCLVSHFEKLRSLIHAEKYLLERGLAKLPTGGNPLPDILRYKRLQTFLDLLKTKVDEDGFEFVDGQDGLVLLSDNEDVEDLLSDDSQSDEDD